MGRELKPIYVCDKCGTTYYDRLQIRVFKDFIYDGEKEKTFIDKLGMDERMLCKGCTIIELDLETQPSQKVLDEVVEKISNDKEFWNKLDYSSELYEKINHNEHIMDEINSRHDETSNTLEYIIEEPTLEDLEKIITDNSWTAGVESKVGDIVEHFDGNTYEITDVYTQQDELRKEIIEKFKVPSAIIGPEFSEENISDIASKYKDGVDKIISEILDDKKEIIKDDLTVTYTPVQKDAPSVGEMEYLDDGKYLILFRIDTEEQESYLSRSYGHKKLEDLRECCGKPLIGIYVSTDKYINELKLLEPKEVQIINKVFMGIPNIINRVVILDANNDSLAYIPKEDFDLQIESLPIELPVIEEEIDDDGERDITAEFLEEESEYV